MQYLAGRSSYREVSSVLSFLFFVTFYVKKKKKKKVTGPVKLNGGETYDLLLFLAAVNALVWKADTSCINDVYVFVWFLSEEAN